MTTVETVHIDCPDCAEDIAVPVRLGPVYTDLAPGVVYVSVGADPVEHTCTTPSPASAWGGSAA